MPDQPAEDQVAPGVADPEADLIGLDGIFVIKASDGADALIRVGSTRPDLLLVSARLPGIDAATVIRTVRRALCDLPIILGAGPEDAEIMLQGLEAGATACVAKPYRSQELLPLIQATHGTAHGPLTVGDIELNNVAHTVRVRGEVVHVPLRELELLHYLMRNVGRVVTKQEIARHVWNSRIAPPHNTISVHIKRLRTRIGDDDKIPAIIRTVRGLGYRIAAPGSDWRRGPPRSRRTLVLRTLMPWTMTRCRRSPRKWSTETATATLSSWPSRCRDPRPSISPAL
ncbi:response regulator transcription factor [Nonomuraea typhae]|uniref:response regulator transcription factor n=1 Tax=Nonomuraea typhae TaxID=2603600 RepID=UPI0015E2090A|nr:response regulator transcription factor [Nonomuraea typhae]